MRPINPVRSRPLTQKQRIALDRIRSTGYPGDAHLSTVQSLFKRGLIEAQEDGSWRILSLSERAARARERWRAQESE